MADENAGHRVGSPAVHVGCEYRPQALAAHPSTVPRRGRSAARRARPPGRRSLRPGLAAEELADRRDRGARYWEEVEERAAVARRRRRRPLERLHRRAEGTRSHHAPLLHVIDATRGDPVAAKGECRSAGCVLCRCAVRPAGCARVLQAMSAAGRTVGAMRNQAQPPVERDVLDEPCPRCGSTVCSGGPVAALWIEPDLTPFVDGCRSRARSPSTTRSSTAASAASSGASRSRPR